MKTNSLTFTRFLAAICVVVFHYGTNIFPFNTKILSSFFQHSHIFVSYFFFLSGFVMMIAYHEQFKLGTFNKWNYWLKRIVRIYPIYLFATLLLCGIFTYFEYWDSKFSIKDLFLNLFLIQSWQKETALTLNYPGWSLSVEIFFYLMFPFIISIINKSTLKTNIYLYTLIWLASQVAAVFLLENHYHPLIHLNTFWGGVLLGKLLLELDHRLNWIKKRADTVLLISLIALIIILGTQNPIVDYCHEGMLTPIFAAIIIGLIYSNNRAVNFISKPSFIRLGEISYGIYILQYPIRFVTEYLNDITSHVFSKNPQSDFYFYLFILIIFSTITYYLIEVPSKKLISRKKRFHKTI